ncbi:hypothetical protein C8R47DRAFT_1203581 [Mycena vitilis]|nr:hypothetical protein C8R47DRAFT_1203581 [Mycena vitilis]
MAILALQTTSMTATPTPTTTAIGTLTSAIGSPSASCLSTGALCGPPTSPGTLYLFTFLATLLLLTTVAGGITARSVYLRRRERRLIAAGILPPRAPRTLNSTATEKDSAVVKKKPKMYEVCFGSNEIKGAGEVGWEGIVPLSASYAAPAKVEIQPSLPEPAQEIAPAFIEPVFGLRAFLNSRRRHVLRSNNALSNPMPNPNLIDGTNTDPVQGPPAPAPSSLPEPLRAEVACVIAMPAPPAYSRSPSRNSTSGDVDADAERQLPMFEIGVAAVDVTRTNEPVEDDGEEKSGTESELDKGQEVGVREVV